MSYLTHILLTHCGLVTPYGDTDLGQTLAQVMLPIVAWQHQAITWTNVDLLQVRTSDGPVTFI